MKPYKTLIFFVSVALILLALVFVFPENGIPIGNDFKLYYPTYEELLGSNHQKHQLVDSLITNQLALLDEDIEQDEEQVVFPDSVESLLDIPLMVRVFQIDTLKTKIQKIEFANNNKSLLYNFFRRLHNPKHVVRVLHYGDSQIEGDRISSFLRNRLQKKFGGYGVGLVSPKPLVKPFSVNQTYSDNWLRFPIFGNKEGKVKHKRYGGLGVFCRYAPNPLDSLSKEAMEVEQASQMLNAEITFSRSNSAFIKDRQVKKFTIFYANASEPVLTEIYEGENLLFAKYLKTNTLMSKMQFSFPHTPKQFTVKFSGNDSPDFYAMALDADRGVVVDNIPMRGSSGTYFNKMDLSVLKAFYDNIDLGMILLEFGGNVIPFIETEQGVKNYESWFYSQIKTLRRLNPKVPIIVLGVADMSKKDKDQFVSYPYIEPIRDAMKRAAFRAGAAYWDMYEAMGGENSMPEWVNSNPKLATNDYTHYTPRGARLIGNMFFNALMYEYQLYQN